ncbi:MAG: hypothetical protein GZ089_14130 [Aromatoleum sp.]|nr:hypothetical protein [Aromatoleum sp.]
MSDTPRAIAFARRDAIRGAVWLKDAYAMLSVNRVPWLLLLLLYYLVLGIVDLIPYVGQIAVPLLKPVFAVGFLAAAWTQERGGAPELKLLFQGFRSNVRALLPLGAFLLVGITVAVLGTAVVDGGTLVDVLSGRTKLDETVLASGDVQLAMLFAAACALPVLLAIWFAPALVVFQDCGPARALATSLRAALANWKPISVYGLLVFCFGGVVPTLATLLISSLMPEGLALPLVLLVLMPYLFLLIATLHISDYVSYRDIFHVDQAPNSPDGADGSPPSQTGP